jgi:hypothetical protein
VRTWQSAAAMRASRCGVRSCASLKAADGDDLVPGPDSDGEGAGSATQNGVGAIIERLKGWDDTAPTDPDEGGREKPSWQLARQLGARIVPGQRNSRKMQVFEKFLIIASTDVSLFCKNLLGNTRKRHKMLQPGKDQCLSSDVLGVRGAQKVTLRTKLLRRRMRKGCPLGSGAVFRLLRSTQDDKRLFVFGRCEASRTV